MCAKVLVTDGRSLASLAIIRSLGSLGDEIHSGESFKHSLSSYSKYIEENVTYPDPEEYSNAFVEYLLQRCEREGYDLVIPVRDAATVQLSKHREEFERVTNVFIADHNKLAPLMDKGETIKIAQKVDVPTPKTWFPEQTDVSQIKKEIEETVDYPVLVRPRRSSGARGIQFVGNRSEFDDSFKQVSQNFGIPIVQEYINHSGGHYSIGYLFDSHSRPLATHVYKETKQYPTNGGPAVNAISVEKPQWVTDFIDILKYIGWVGPAHMDVLYDPESKEPKLLEVNPRFWMSIQIGISSGVNFPKLLRELAMGRETEAVEDYQTGVVYRWVLPNEILWLLNHENKAQGVRELFSFDRDQECYGSLSLSDPMPIVGTFAQSIRYILNPERRKQIFDRGW